MWNLKPFTSWRFASGPRFYHRRSVDGPIGSFKHIPFLWGRDKLIPQEELLTSKTAKARIQLKKNNERIKKFRLISGTTLLNMTSLATQAVFVVCCLGNVQDQLAT